MCSPLGLRETVVLQKLHSVASRVVIFKQMRPVVVVDPDEAEASLLPDKPNRNEDGVFLTCLYDSRNVVFISSVGDCLYVSRDQLKPGGL